MEKEDIEEKKKKVINEFTNTKKLIRSIARENNLSLEEVYAILEEYNEDKIIKRPGNTNFSSKKTLEESYEKIYQLRKQRKNYETISQETGISVSEIKLICKKIFDEKGEEVPRWAKHNSHQTVESKKIDEMIFNLVQEGKKYREIQEELKKIGMTVSIERIRQRYERKVLENQKDLANMILNLITTKKATLEQVQIIADYYGVDLEETMNSLDER